MRLFFATLIFVIIFLSITISSPLLLLTGAALMVCLLISDLSQSLSKDLLTQIAAPRGIILLIVAFLAFLVGLYFNISKDYVGSKTSLTISLVFLAIDILINP